MAQLIREITIKVERRQVAVLMPDGSERLGFFHKWSYDNDLGKDFALVETPKGIVEHVPVERIRFLPIGNEVAAEELETMYRENGILKG